MSTIRCPATTTDAGPWPTRVGSPAPSPPTTVLMSPSGSGPHDTGALVVVVSAVVDVVSVLDVVELDVVEVLEVGAVLDVEVVDVSLEHSSCARAIGGASTRATLASSAAARTVRVATARLRAPPPADPVTRTTL